MKYLVLCLFFIFLMNSKQKKLREAFRYSLLRKNGYQEFMRKVKLYKYEFSIKKQLVFMIFLVLVLLLLAQLFQMNYEHILLLGLLLVAFIPNCFITLLHYQYEEKVFFNVTSFFQYFLAQYKSDSQLYHSLNEVRIIAEDELKVVIERVLERLKQEGDAAVFKDEMMGYIPHFIIINITNYVNAIERHGSDEYSRGIDLLQEDVEQWIDDTYMMKSALIKVRNRICLLAGFSCIIAFSSLEMLGKIEFDFQTPIYQNMIFLYFIIVLFTVYKAMMLHQIPWIDQGECLC